MRKLFITLILVASLIMSAWAALNPASLPYLMQKEFDGRDLKLVKVLESNKYYSRYYITYKSGKLTISGIMNVPQGKGPFPVIITAHGFIDPKYYTTGRGLKHEQDYLAKEGYAVLHPDFRNHAGSDVDPNDNLNLHIGYTEDVINAVYAIKNTNFKFINKDRIGMLGHSLGGGIALNMMVIKPELVKAYVLFAPISIDFRDNFNRWILRRHEPKFGPPEVAKKIIEKYGSPDANPEFWDNISVKNFIDNVKDPLIVHHGKADKSVPPEWSDRLELAFREHHKEITLYTYSGEGHEFSNKWPLVMKRSVNFFDKYLKI